MLRKVSEDDIIQRSAEDMASKRSDEDMELYKARLRRNFESRLRRMRKRSLRLRGNRLKIGKD